MPLTQAYTTLRNRQHRARGMARTIEEYTTKEETIKLMEQL